MSSTDTTGPAAARTCGERRRLPERGGQPGKRNLQALVRRCEGNTISSNPRLEIVSALVIAPLLEEAVFRLIPFRLAGTFPYTRGRVALGSAILFGLMHQRFGAWFVGYAVSGGLVLWATYARAGYSGAVMLHVAANLVDLSIGWRRRLYLNSGRTLQPPR